MKCKYNYCKDNSELNSENTVIMNNMNYHLSCSKKMKAKKAIRELYAEKVSNTVIFSQLNNIIKNIIDEREISPEYFYFALRYAINHNFIIKAPAGLYYILDNFEIKEAYKKFTLKNIKKETPPVVVIEEEKEITFVIENKSQNKWNFFGGQ